MLHDLFSQFGVVVSLTMADNSAIVEFEDFEDAEAAADDMHGCELGGEYITVVFV